MQNIIKNTLTKFLVFSMLAYTIFGVVFVGNAAEVQTISDVLTRNKISTAAGHVIAFKPSAALAANDTVTVDLNDPTDFSTKEAFNVATAVVADITLRNATQSTNFVTEAIAATTLPACSGASANRAVAMYDATNEKIAVTLCATSLTVASTDEWWISAGSTSSGGTDFITNPGTAGTNADPVSGSITWVDSSASDTIIDYFAANIVANDEVTVTGTVEPFLTTTFSGNTCALQEIPVLTTDNLGDCGYNLTVATNAQSGFQGKVFATNGLCKDDILDGSCTASTYEDINDVSGNSATLTSGTEGYGISTSDSSGTGLVINAAGCGTDGTPTAATSRVLSSLDARTVAAAENWIASAAETTASGEVQGLCHWATGDMNTEPGTYSQTVRHSVTAIF